MIDMRDQPFGVEIEMTGLTRQQAAEVLARLWETHASYSGGTYGAWPVLDPQGKEWKLMSDGSIRPERWVSGTRYTHADSSDYRAELVTPKLTYAEIPELQTAVRALREAHAKVNDSCGLHVHIDASKHDQQSLKNLMAIMYSKEDMLFEALKVPEDRVERWCKPVRENMLVQARHMSANSSMDRLQRIWYEGSPDIYSHYNHTRYHALNLHSVFYRGTVELRCFNSTLHAGRVKSYVQFSLALSAQAINQRGAQMRKTRSDNPAFTFRTWLLRMGMIGDEFKTARKLLLKELEGDKSWRYDKDVYEEVMAYVMGREFEKEPHMPSASYFLGIADGYKQNGIPFKTLYAALDECKLEVEAARQEDRQRQFRFGFHEYGHAGWETTQTERAGAINCANMKCL